jgi:laccase
MNYHPQTFQLNHSITKLALYKPNLPPLNYTSFATDFTSKLRSLAGDGFPANVPQKVDRQFFFTVGLTQTNVLKTKPVRDQMDL